MTAGLLALSACGQPVAPLLAELPSFHGRIALRTVGGTAVEGELAFDRGNGNLQFTVRGPEQTVAISRHPIGGVAVFRDGVPVEATPAEVERFALVERVVAAAVPSTTKVARDGDGYTLTDAGGSISVRILEVFGAGVHGWR